MTQRWSNRMERPLGVMLGLMLTLGGLPPGTHGVAAAPLTLPRAQGQERLPSLTLTLTATPTRMVQFQLGTIAASLNRPVTDGRITFTLVRPAPALALYSCTPSRGRCSMAWSRRTPGSVTIAARWSGDRQYGPAGASLTMAMRRSRYTYTATWQGAPLGPLTQVVPPVAVTHLAHATPIGRLYNFRTNDPAYTCLNGRALDVFMAPQVFPDDDVAYTRGQGAHCPAGTWLYPQEPAMPAMHLAITALDPVITLHGTFPLPHPYTGVVQFFTRITLVAERPIISWAGRTVTVRVPPRLPAGTYSVRVGWYDRLTGSTVRSRVPCYVQLNVPVATTPISILPTNTPTSVATAMTTPTAAWTATAAPPQPTVTPANTATTVPSSTPTDVPTPTATDVATATPTDTPSGTTTATPTASPTSRHTIKTVFLIVMENHNWSSTAGNTSEAPYINSLITGTNNSQTSYATQYYTPPGNHPSLLNYLWVEAGTSFGIADDKDPSSHPLTTTTHLVSLLSAAGISWKAYEENISGTTCPLADSYPYKVHHDPFVYFTDVTNNQSITSTTCLAHVRPYTDLATDLKDNTVARYNFITPNMCDDMHDACFPTNDAIKQGDTWLANNVPAILGSQAYKKGGALFITWDEGQGSSDGPIGMLVLSPAARGHGYSNTLHYTHSSTLRTLEEIFGVSPWLGDAANAHVIDLRDLFTTFP